MSAPLDLRAVEEQYGNVPDAFHGDAVQRWTIPRPQQVVEDVTVLLAHCRALRAALQQARPFIIRERRPTTLAQLDAVLAQAIDGET